MISPRGKLLIDLRAKKWTIEFLKTLQDIIKDDSRNNVAAMMNVDEMIRNSVHNDFSFKSYVLKECHYAHYALPVVEKPMIELIVCQYSVPRKLGFRPEFIGLLCGAC